MGLSLGLPFIPRNLWIGLSLGLPVIPKSLWMGLSLELPVILNIVRTNRSQQGIHQQRTCLWLALALCYSKPAKCDLIQAEIYKQGPCGDQMNKCDEPAPIIVWVQTVPYVFIGFSEIFTSITGLEFAFTKAPKNMRSLVTSYWHFMSAFSSAIGQAFTSVSEDPLLVWNYGIVSVLAFIGGILFWFHQRPTDKREDSLNMLADSNYIGRGKRNSVEEAERTAS